MKFGAVAALAAVLALLAATATSFGAEQAVQAAPDADWSCAKGVAPDGAPPIDERAFVGFLKRVEGAVFVHRAGEPEPLPAALAMRLFPLDAIEAGADGAFDILFTDSSTVSGIAGACMHVAQYSYTPGARGGRFELRLERGVIAVGAGDIAKLYSGAMTVAVRRDANLVVEGTRLVIRAE